MLCLYVVCDDQHWKTWKNSDRIRDSSRTVPVPLFLRALCHLQFVPVFRKQLCADQDNKAAHLMLSLLSILVSELADLPTFLLLVKAHWRQAFCLSDLTAALPTRPAEHNILNMETKVRTQLLLWFSYLCTAQCHINSIYNQSHKDHG